MLAVGGQLREGSLFEAQLLRRLGVGWHKRTDVRGGRRAVVAAVVAKAVAVLAKWAVLLGEMAALQGPQQTSLQHVRSAVKSSGALQSQRLWKQARQQKLWRRHWHSH